MSQFYFPQDTYYGIPVLKDDSAEMSQKFMNLSNVLRQNQADSDQQRMAEMAAARLEQYGPQGSYWGEQIRKDPRAAMMLADAHGGFGAIEEQLASAQAQGASRDAMERAIQADGGAGLSPAELEIFRQGGPDALKNFRDAMNPSTKAPTSRNRKLPNGYSQLEEWDGSQWNPVGQPAPPSGGLAMEFDDQGRVVGFSMGGGKITNTTRAKVEEKSFNAQGMLSRLDQIRSSFRPEFQTWGNKIRIGALKAKSASGLALGGDEEQQLRDVASFKSAAFHNMNRVLNELSGAAISPAEAERLKQELPDPGTGLFDGDDPVTFREKMDSVESRVREAINLYDQQLSRSGPQQHQAAPASKGTPDVNGRPPKPPPVVNGQRVEWKWDPEAHDWYYGEDE